MMVDASLRISEATIQFLFELLFSLTLIHKDFDFLANKVPKIQILLTNFSRFNSESSDSDDSFEITDSAQTNEEKFDMIINALYTQLSGKICENIYTNTDQPALEKILSNLKEFIIPKDNFYTQGSASRRMGEDDESEMKRMLSMIYKSDAL